MAVQIISFANFLASFFSSVPNKLFGQKKTLFWGSVLITLSLAMISLFIYTEHSLGIIVMLMTMIITFQSSLGPILFIHAQETCVDAAVGFAQFNSFL
mmetsp:Transcript_5134/g.8731  ORF Transcript_5134/g.8731 Transcript_5134/m.8731 type:complete len:98 (-) Transcript_5134:663-956(-)